MQLELAAPCCLTLAAARLDGRPALLGLALRHPPVQLEAFTAENLSITGARADAAYVHAARLEAQHGAPLAGSLEIELAIPRSMGRDSGLGPLRPCLGHVQFQFQCPR